MKRPLSILLVEDDPHDCLELTEYIETLDDVVLVGATGYAEKALELLKDCIPDCLILDLELHEGSGNGLSILKAMKDLSLPLVPYVLVTTNNSSQITYEAARQLGADFIFFKHQVSYSAENVIEFLRTIKSIIQNHAAKTHTDVPTETPQMRQKRLIRRIQAELNLIGISPKLKGYQYLTDAILLIIDKPQTHLPSVIGKKYNASGSSVERAMQNALAKAWGKTDTETLFEAYTANTHSEKGVPTITEFTHYYANKIRNDL